MNKSAHVEIDAKVFLSCSMVQLMTLAQEGQMLLDIHHALERRDTAFLRKFPFIKRIGFGAAKRTHIPLRIRRAVLAAGCCATCVATDRLTIDHKKPYSRGGTDDISNLQCLCFNCNLLKSDQWKSE